MRVEALYMALITVVICVGMMVINDHSEREAKLAMRKADDAAKKVFDSCVCPPLRAKDATRP